MYRLILIFGLILPNYIFGQLSGTFAFTSGMGSDVFCFKNNGTFTFIGRTDLLKMVDTGTYSLNSDTLVLNSNVQLNDLLRVKKWSIKGVDSIYISINLYSGENLNSMKLIFNDSIEFRLMKGIEGGLIKLEKGNIKSLQVQSRFLPWQLMRQKIYLEDDNFVEIFIDDTKGNNRLFFKDKLFLLRKTYIQTPMSEGIFYSIQPNLTCD